MACVPRPSVAVHLKRWWEQGAQFDRRSACFYLLSVIKDMCPYICPFSLWFVSWAVWIYLSVHLSIYPSVYLSIYALVFF